MENLKILEEKENYLFNRKEIKLNVNAEITPSNSEVEKFISEKLSAPVENIKIKKISGKFGSKTFTVIINIYNSKEDKNRMELKTKKSKEKKK